MNRVAVTGATGHLGNELVRQLGERGVPVRALVLPGESPDPIANGATVIEADITKPATLYGAFVGCKTVFHAAGLIQLGKGNLPRLRAVNVEGTRHVLEAARTQGVRRFVFTSSIHAFADVGTGTLDETGVIDPDRTFSDYARSKAEATLLVRRAQEAGFDTVILYPVGITGPYDFKLSYLSKFILDFRAGRWHLIPSGGYFFIDVRDTARLHIQAADRAPPGSEFILCREYQTTAQLVSSLQVPDHRHRVMFVPPRLAVWGGRLARAFGARGEFVFGDHASHELQRRYYIRTARADLGLGRPKIPIAASLADAASWLENSYT